METKRKQKNEESINQYEFTATPDTLTFVTRFIGPLDWTVTLGDIAGPGFRNVQNSHKIQILGQRAMLLSDVL